MTAQEFHRRTTRDESDFLDRFLETLRDLKAPFCVIGGQGVNAYAEPVVSLDLDVVVVAERVSELESILRTRFKVERFEHSLNVSAAGSDLRVQIQYDPRYQPFLSRCDEHTMLGRVLPVAALNDGKKIWRTSRGSLKTALNWPPSFRERSARKLDKTLQVNSQPGRMSASNGVAEAP
ncbi:MAG: hypothetical protein DME26_09880 [Verrucomicrobia bacterium]|nr:MAG: hypothetical protein DME26_09880 [Verrucomicrobiota bacterium]